MTNFRKFTALLLSLIMIVGAVPAVGLTALAMTLPSGTFTYTEGTFDIQLEIPTALDVGAFNPEDESSNIFKSINGIPLKNKDSEDEDRTVNCNLGIALSNGEKEQLKEYEAQFIEYKNKTWFPLVKYFDVFTPYEISSDREYSLFVNVCCYPELGDSNACKININGQSFKATPLNEGEYCYFYTTLDLGTLDENGNLSGGDFDTDVKLENIATDITVAQPVCGEKLATTATVTTKDNVTIDPKNTAVRWYNADGTQVANGSTARCGETYTAQVAFTPEAKEGYKLTDATTATANINGKAVKVENFSGEYIAEYEFSKINHVWDDGKVVKNATTKTGAVRLFTCTVCQNGVKTEYLPQSTQTIKLLKKKYKAKNNTVKIKAKAKTGLSFKAVKKSKYYRVNKFGKITFKNGAKGTYKIKVKITAKVNDSYKQATTTKVIKVKVK